MRTTLRASLSVTAIAVLTTFVAGCGGQPPGGQTSGAPAASSQLKIALIAKSSLSSGLN